MVKSFILIYPSFERGGVRKNFLSFIEVLKNKKHKLEIISDQKILSEVKKKKNISINIIKRLKFKIFYKYFTSLFASLKILSIPNIKRVNLRVISFQSSFFTSIICKLLRYKLIVRVSEDPIGATKYSDNYFISFFVLLSKLLTYNISYKVLVNSKKSQGSVRKFVINKKKVILQYNMNLKKIYRFKKLKKKNYFLNVGRFCKQKNQENIIKAFSLFIKKNENKNYKLFLCGDGPDKKKLKNMVKKLKLTKYIKFENWQKNTVKLYLKSKYFILPSLYEGLPNVLIDALNYDLVCICSDVSGIQDICGNSFFKVSRNNSHELSNKMNLAVKNYKKYLCTSEKKKLKLKKFLKSNLYNELINNLR